MSFFQEQFKQTGLSKEENEIEVYRVEGEEQKTILHLYSETNIIYEKDAKGVLTNKVASSDLKIQYPDLYGGVYTYKTDAKNSNEKWFFRVRHQIPKRTDDGKEQKYSQPAKSGIIPFFNVKLIKAYKSKEEIETLFLVEGEKKASKMCSEGFFAIGIIGITGWRQGAGNPSLHYDICEFIEVCKVKQVVLLTDADTLTIKYDSKENLAKRPFLFYNNVSDFKNATNELINSNRYACEAVYYSFLQTKNLEKGAKGIDDLFNLYPLPEKKEKPTKLELEQYRKALANREEIVKDIHRELKDLSFGGRYLQSICISMGDFSRLKQIFGIENERVFYKVYNEHIGLLEFNFRGTRYQFYNEKLNKLKHHDTDKFAYVHDQLYKKVAKIDARGKSSQSFKAIREPFVKNQYRDYDGFLDEIERFESFCVYPDNTENYKQIIGNAFNLYHKIQHDAELGKWDETYRFLKHIARGKSTIEFNEKGEWSEHFDKGCPFAMLIDWMSILLQKPLEKLPVPCLYSPENSTGKSTVMHLLEKILGENGTVLGNEEFLMSFNAHYITKAFVGLDEAMIQKDVEKERLKKMVTQKHGYLQFKGKDMEKIDFFAKFMFCTNKKDFMRVEAEETRWFIIRVHPLEESEKRADILEDYLTPEIPQFLFYLLNRNIFHEKVSRTWFNEKYYKNAEFMDLVSETKYSSDKQIEEFIKDSFLTFQYSPMYLSPKFITEQINKYAKYKIDKTTVTKYLKDKKGLEPLPPKKIKQPVGIVYFMNEDRIEFVNETARCYEFHYEDWLSKEDIEEYVVVSEDMKAVHRMSEVANIEETANITKEDNPTAVKIEPEALEISFELTHNPDEETTF